MNWWLQYVTQSATWRDKESRIRARGAEYRAGAMSEEQFAAYLFSMGERGEDIRTRLNDYAPAPPGLTHEDARLEASRQWLKEYRRG